MSERTDSLLNETEIKTTLAEVEVAELERRAAQFGIDRSELMRRYIRAGLSVRTEYGTIVDVSTGEHLAPATERHVRIWIKSYNSVSAPGLFAIDSEGRPVALALAERTDRRVTILDPPIGFDTTRPSSPQNSRILDEMRRQLERETNTRV